jgi:hypothetical protein
VLLGSGTIGAALLLLRLIGGLIDERGFTARWRGDALIVTLSILASLFSAGGISLAFYGARALYFDMLLGGADRQPLWSSGPSLAAIAVWAIAVIAAAGGIARRAHSGEVCVFIALFVAAVLDARMAPFFAIAVVPPLLARYRRFAVPLQIGAPVAAICVAAAAVVPLRSDAGPASLLASVASDHHAHRVVCVKPVWCNPVLDLQSESINALAIGIPEASSPNERALQMRIADDSSHIIEQMRAAHADTLIATQAMSAAGLLLTTHGWHVVAREPSGYRFALQRESRQ